MDSIFIVECKRNCLMNKMKWMTQRTISEYINNNCQRNPSLEMAKLNMKDGGNSLFPSNTYNIIVQGDDSSQNPPHIHVISKQEGYNIKILIENGDLWQVVSYGKRNRSDTFTDAVKNIKYWLKEISNIPMAKGDTNQVFAMGLWELNN